jgi:hypothetical protein
MKIKTLTAIVYLIAILPVVAQDNRTWTGKWGNRKYGTSGPLKCVAQESKPGVWNAVFSGTFKASGRKEFPCRTGLQARRLVVDSMAWVG